MSLSISPILCVVLHFLQKKKLNNKNEKIYSVFLHSVILADEDYDSKMKSV